MHTVRFEGKTSGTAECDRETALLAASTRAEVPLPHRCGGHARCGTCLITVVEGAEHLSEKGAAEIRVLQALKANPEQRLACQTWAAGDVSVKY